VLGLVPLLCQLPEQYRCRRGRIRNRQVHQHHPAVAAGHRKLVVDPAEILFTGAPREASQQARLRGPVERLIDRLMARGRRADCSGSAPVTTQRPATKNNLRLDGAPPLLSERFPKELRKVIDGAD